MENSSILFNCITVLPQLHILTKKKKKVKKKNLCVHPHWATAYKKEVIHLGKT